MEIKLDIEFEQVLELVKQLPARQLSELKSALEKAEKPKRKKRDSLKKFLLEAPQFSNIQIEQIAQTRKAINQWRIK